MIASLPMYDRPENAAAHDALWALVRDGVRARGGDAPDALDRETHFMEGWGRPDLVLGQICNLPYRAKFRDKVTVLGCADYALPETPAGYYRSFIVVRTDDADAPLETALRGRLAYNDPLSHSGWGAVYDLATELGIAPNPTLNTGAHLGSLHALVEGRADVASIDALTWRMLTQWCPEAENLRVIGQTAASPGMSFITSPANDPEPLRAALAEAIAALGETERAILGIEGFVIHPERAYDVPVSPMPGT